VLENLVHIVTELHGRHLPLELSFLHSHGERFILTDRPTFVVDGIGRFLVLTDRVAIKYQKGSLACMYEDMDVEGQFVSYINRFLALKARDWIVANNMSSLNKWVQINNSDDAEDFRNSERPALIKPVALSTGFSFRESQGTP
jgi:hypothetical protein